MTDAEYVLKRCKIMGLHRVREEGPADKKWRLGKLIRKWKNGSASIRPHDWDDEEDGWLVLRPGEWREVVEKR